MMLQYKAVMMSLVALTLLGGCNNSESDPDKQTSVKIDFVEHEKYVKPYPTRLIVTNQFMRFDDGEGSTSFILFNRKTDTIYSVNDDDRTVMSLKRQDIELEPPMELKLEERNLGTLDDAPEIQGMTPVHYQFFANDEVCYDVVAVKGLMPDVVDAMQAFKAILANDSKVTFNNIPADLHDACDMSMSTFASGRHLEHGFPIQEWSVDGDGRTLVNYDENYDPDPALFELPEDYRHFSVQDMRGGKVTGGGH
ncbi:hypothetical protein [Thiohalophilus sp.]|uniref:hypothetical protein n=1 Tax=Thiohalophilus sp. TaxID=3028392 RepID=UPI002ACDD7DC|nr:hypothetical protein [Thiohalophilus sp.]MDZ7804240.1 hypothetical protein [Thiohalophilus sp.]